MKVKIYFLFLLFTLHSALSAKTDSGFWQNAPCYNRPYANTGLFVFGRPMSMGCDISACSGNWQKQYAGFALPGTIKAEVSKDRTRYEICSEACTGAVSYAWTAPGRLEGRVLVHSPKELIRASAELFRLDERIFRGCGYHGELTDGQKLKGTFAPDNNTGKRLILGDGIRTLTVALPHADMKLTVSPESTLPLELSDWRSRRWPEAPYFSLGVNAALLKAGTSGKLILTVDFRKKEQQKECSLDFELLKHERTSGLSGLQIRQNGYHFSRGNSLGISSLDWKNSLASCNDSKSWQEICFRDYYAGKIQNQFGSTCLEYLAVDDNTLEITGIVSLGDKADGRATLEVLRLNPMLMTGRSMVCTESRSNRTKTVSIPLERLSEKRFTLAQNCRKIVLDSKAGPIIVEVLNGSNMALEVADWRGRNWPEAPYLFIGANNHVIKRKQEGMMLKLRVTFPGKQMPAGIIATLKTPPQLKTNLLMSRQTAEPEIFPTPKQCTYTGRTMPLPDRPAICFKGLEKQDQKHLLAFLNRRFRRRFGLEWRLADGRKAQAVLRRKEVIPGIPKGNRQGYSLSVRPDGIRMEAASVQGAAYALETLAALMGNKPAVPELHCAEILDYPSLPIRAIHCFSGRDAGAMQEHFVENIFAPGKINAVVYECGYVKWKTTPLAYYPKYAMEKEEARRVVNSMKMNFIEPIPLIQSIGHIDWLNRNIVNQKTGQRAYGQYLVDDKAYLTCFNPLNPAGIDFLYKLYDEVIQFFQPKYFHLGFDECITGGKQLAHLSVHSGIAAEDLFLRQFAQLYPILKRRNITPMIWGDILLDRKTEACDYGHAPNLEAARKMRRAIPRDVIVADWHYGNFRPEQYISLDVLHKDGFQVLASPTYFPQNIAGFNYQAVKTGALGSLHTTWAGFSFDDEGFNRFVNQYYSYVLSAQAAWTGGAPKVEEMSVDMSRQFVKLWNRDRFSKYFQKNAKGKSAILPLNEAFNLKLSEAPDGMASCHALGTIKQLHTADLNWNFDGTLTQAVQFSSKFNRNPASVKTLSMPVQRKFDRLLLVLCTSTETDFNARVATLKFHYSDGTAQARDFLYGRNILSFNAKTYKRVWDHHAAFIVHQGKTAGGSNFALRGTEIINAHPEKAVRRITLESADSEASLLLFAAGLLGME